MKQFHKTLILFFLILTLVPLSVNAEEAYLSPDAALAVLKEAMLSRQTEVSMRIQVPSDQWDGLATRLWNQSFAHTGAATEGDYLHRHTKGMKYQSTYHTQNDTVYATVTFTISYHSTGAQEKDMEAKYQQVLASLQLAGKSDFEKVKAIQDYITANVSYDHENLDRVLAGTYSEPLTAYSALMNGIAVCQGYTSLFYRLALDAGLDCRIISGIGNGGPHAWNIVRINGTYYNIDPTWNENTDSYNFFLKGTENFSDHTTDAEFLTAEFTAQYPISLTDYDPASAPVCTHQNTQLQNAVAPGCTAEGYSGDLVCADCGSTITPGSSLAPSGHTEETIPAKAPTCTDTGLTEGTRCAVCATILVPQETVANTDHTWDNGTITAEPTCDQEGQLVYTCQSCGTQNTDTIPALRGSFLKIDQQDTILSKKYAVKDPKTDTQQTFSYTTPEQGVTMLVFFSNQCGNSRFLMQQLDACKWMSNPYLNVVAVESVATSAPPVMDFISTQSPNTAPLIDYYYAGSAKLAFAYYRLFSDKTSLTWPVVLLITDDGIVRYGTDAATSITDIYNVLNCISPAFAAYERGEEVETPEIPVEPESDICTLQVAGMREYDEIQEVLRLVNEQRTASGLNPVVLDAAMTELAMQRAAECALYYSHTRPNGSDCFTILKENNVSYRSAGENIAAAQFNANDVMYSWMNSPGHRANILTSGFTHAGLGCVTVNGTRYWVQLFASGPSSTTSDTTSGQAKFLTPVQAYKNLAGVHTPESITCTVDPALLGSYTHRFCYFATNGGIPRLSATLIPILGDARDSSGKVIATITSADDGSGELVITAMAEGTGTVTLPLYEGEPDPLVLTITVTLTQEECRHESGYPLDARAPTCSESGYTGDHYCDHCGALMSKGSILPATGHQWDQGTVTTEPAVGAEGVLTFTCTNGCGQTKTEAIPALDAPCTHANTTLENSVAATCTLPGYSGDTRCTDCGETIATGNATPALGHTWDKGTVTVQPTEDTPGVLVFACVNNCGLTKTESISPLEKPTEPCAHTNTSTVNAKAPTCIQEGYSGDTVCNDCKETVTQGTAIPAAGHKWSEGAVTTEPTQDSEGVISFQCLICKETKTETIPQLKPCTHASTTTVNAKTPTCTQEGYSGDVVCCDCNKTVTTGTAIPATGHKWDEGTVTTEATEEAEGIKTYTCTNGCGETRTETIPALPPSGFTRLAGANRFETAFAVADALKAKLGVEKFDNVIIASGSNFADALSGSYLAAVKNAPILLSYTTADINNAVKDYIRANLTPGGTVYILGGTNAVPAGMEQGLTGFTIRRLAGADRFGTNLAILAEAGYAGKDVLVCTGADFADSLSASAAKLPILLVWKELTLAQKGFLETVGGNLYVIGGTDAVSDSLMNQLKVFGKPIRLGGSNRFETSVLIAKTFFPSAQEAVLAYAWNFPDGLCGGPLAAAMDAPLILTMTCYEEAAANYTTSRKVNRGYVLGSEELIPESSLDAIMGNATAGHAYVSQVKKPACLEGGHTTHTCGKCGKTYTDAKTTALGHDFEETVVYPTFDEGGYTLSTCKTCGHTKRSDRTGALDSALEDVLDLVNEVRAEAGLNPLTYCFDGQKAGDIRAREIITYFDHTRPNGERCFTALTEIGFEYWAAGENIAIGYPNAQAVMNGWMNSDGHRANILNPIFTGLIIGKQGSAWVMLLVC